MNITIIGAGNMGRGIGTIAVRGGHTVTIIDRDPAEARRLVSELAGQGSGTAREGTPGTIDGDVVVLAVAYGANRDLARELGSALDGKVVVDIANPVDFATFESAVPHDSSSAEEVAAVVPAARVVKAFNTTFAGVLVAGTVAGYEPDVLIAGDDQAAKDVVAGLVRDGGLTAVDVGPLSRAHQLENLGYLSIVMQQPLGLNFASTWKLLR